jgi:subtilisin inhibitor-like
MNLAVTAHRPLRECLNVLSCMKIVLAVSLVATLTAVAGCTESPTGGPSAVPSAGPTGNPSAEPSTSAQSTPAREELIIVFRDGSNPPVTWRLTCNPPGGDHPDQETACRVLDRDGEWALQPVPKNKLCTQVYGGPEQATITGTWRGMPVASRLSLVNGCETARWAALIGLVPKPAVR